MKKPEYNELEARIKELEKESIESQEIKKNLLIKQVILEEQNISIIQKSIEISDVKRKLEDKNFDLEVYKSKLEKTLENLRKSEKELIISRDEAHSASKTKSQFLANMSHEIRTPLNSILGFSSIMLEEENDPEKVKNIEIITKAGENLLNLVNDILDFSKIEAGKLDFQTDLFSLKNLLAHIYDFFSIKSTDFIKFEQNIDKNVPDNVYGDEYRINQIILNLLSNAFKFTRRGKIEFNCTYKNNEAYFEVIDTGVGIPENKFKTIFSAFKQVDASTTRKFGGTGLGLAIVKRLTEKMDGEISLESKIGEGSIFRVMVPLPAADKTVITDNDSQEIIGAIKEHHTEKNNSFKILVAEDNELNIKLMKKLLKKIDVEYFFAENGKSVIEKLEQDSNYDLLLLDIQMPIMDGMETIKHLRKKPELQNLHVIAVTGHAIKGDEEKYIKAGCNDYLSKPIDIPELYKKIEDLKKIK